MKLHNPQVKDLKPWGQCLVRDLVRSILARRLGLNVPEYAIVMFEEAFIRGTTRHPLSGRIQTNSGPNFGSIQVDSILEDVLGSPEEWAATLAFDALGFNADRKASNPNVLWNGDDLR